MKKKHFILTIVTFILFLVINGYAKTQTNMGIFDIFKKENPKNPDNPEDFSYDSAWKQVNELEKKNLKNDALKKVKEIRQNAIKDKNFPQVIKTYFYSLDYENQLNDDGFFNEMKEVEKLLPEFPETDRAVMNSILGEIYLNYLQAEYYTIRKRSEVEEDTTDLKTFSTKRLLKTARKYFFLSIENEGIKNVKTETYKDIIKGDFNKNLEPTLYDFLCNRLIDNYFRKETSRYEVFDDEFNESNPELLADLEKFSALTFDNTKYANSDKYQEMRIYQNLLNFHKNDSDKKYLIFNDIKRLQHYYEQSTDEEKGLLYVNSLKNLENKYKSDNYSANISWRIASYYYNETQEYVEAYKKANEIIKENKDSHCVENAKNLIINIQNPKISTSENEQFASTEDIKLKINHRNVDKIYLRIGKISQSFYEKPYAKHNKMLEKLKSEMIKPVNYEMSVTKNPEYKEDTTEYNIPKQPIGFYAILISTDKNFNAGCIEYTLVQVTDLVPISSTNETDSTATIKVVNRTTGHPIENAKVTVFGEKYKNSGWTKFPLASKMSDKNGNCIFTKKEIEYDGYALEFNVVKNNDIFTNVRMNQIPQRRAPQTETIIKVFTDRALYRPGQTVYFKVLSFTKNGKEVNVSADKNVNISVKDLNGEEIYKTNIKLNEFGSGSDKFEIGKSVVLGNYSFYCNNRYTQDFQVEEYKLPTFEVTAQSPENEIKVNDIIKINGNAKTYSGVNLQNAKVKYEVTRIAKFNGWWTFNYVMNEKQIETSETTTDDDGNFEIQFKAKPDITLPKNNLLTFTYKAKIDVTDINGETRSTTEYVTVGYVGMYLDIKVKDDICFKGKDEFKDVEITSQNASGKHLDAQIDVTVKKLKNFDTPQNNDDIYDLKEEKIVKTSTVNSDGKTKIDLTFLETCEDGNYAIVLTSKDSDGNKITKEKRFTLISQECKKADFNRSIWTSGTEKSFAPDEKAKITVGTSYKDVMCFYEIFRGSEHASGEKVLKLNSNSQIIEIPVTKEDVGGLSMRLFFVKNNTFTTKTLYIGVSDPERNIDIKYETFRDKLLPGESEKIRIKILDNKLKPINAEFLAAMYDESMDAILNHSWYLDVVKSNSYCGGYLTDGFNTSSSNTLISSDNRYISEPTYKLAINWFGHTLNSFTRDMYMTGRSIMFGYAAKESCAVNKKMEICDEAVPMLRSDDIAEASEDIETGTEPEEEIQIRKNFAETAFFYPHLVTDSEGAISIEFTVPESLTKWHFMGMAHTKDMKVKFTDNHLVTQKNFSVEPNLPRFFMEGDQITIPVKINNLTDENIAGNVKIEILDAVTEKPVKDYIVENSKLNFETQASKTSLAEFNITVPKRPEPVIIRVIGISGNHSDGYQKFVPVLTTRTLVTEAQSLYVRANQTKKYTINSILKPSKTQQNQNFVFEFTSNPAWMAFMSLPYLRQNQYECYEQTFSKLYANLLAQKIIQSNPDFEKTYSQMTEKDFESALEKNQELKSIMLNETPWLLDAKNETSQMKEIAHLFNAEEIKVSNKEFIKKLKDGQFSNGGWPWFKGMHENAYITQHILAGFGKLIKLGALDNQDEVKKMTKLAISFCDKEMEDHYKLLKKKLTKEELEKYIPSYSDIEYIYARSFFLENSIPNSTKEAYNFMVEKLEKHWTEYSMLGQAILATAFKRIDKQSVTNDILRSFINNAQYSDEFGMYYSKNLNGYNWWNSPIETQAMIIECFAENGCTKEVEELKIWLIKHKQTNNWKSTKATSEAVYALLMTGEKMSTKEKTVQIKIGGKILNQDDASIGTGYIKRSYSPTEITKEKANIELVNPNNHIAYGATYLQYLDEFDNVKASKNGISIDKKLYLITKNGLGEEILKEITPKTAIHQGNKIKVRFVITTDRDLEYVFLKDHHSSGFEPLNTLSSCKYQDGLCYYESTKDASEEFFLDYLKRGTYVFEYPLIAVHKGYFTNGIASIECMYAPEFRSVSKSQKVKVE
ncbi:MAG: hypothetical protein IKQ46_16170 [Bacteroidales bacterium]|nr:hypothetical protein [Bacteroidales bacterium]